MRASANWPRIGVAIASAIGLGGLAWALLTGAVHAQSGAGYHAYLPLVGRNYQSQHRSGDWVVTGTETSQNAVIWLDGNLRIEPGGNLSLSGVQLWLGGSYNGQFGILVQPGGGLTIDNASVITATQDSARFTFILEPGSQFVMRDSELHGCGWGTPYGDGSWSDDRGLSIRTDDAVLERNLVSDDFTGAILWHSSGARVVANRFLDDPWCGLLLIGSNSAVISDNVFSGGAAGIWAAQADQNTIAGNDFAGHSESAMWFFNGWDNEFAWNTITATSGIALIQVSGNNRIVNNTVIGKWLVFLAHADNNVLRGNRVTSEEGVGIRLEYASHNVIADNELTVIGDPPLGNETNNVAAISLRHGQGNLVANNVITAVNIPGILLWSAATSNTVQSNVIASTYRGLALHYAADHNTVVSNTVSSAAQPAIVVESSSANSIHHNNLTNGGRVPFDDTGTNQWDDGHAGNYWSDYAGNGSTPYAIPPLGTDHHPLLSPVTARLAPVPPFSPVPHAPSPYHDQWQITEPTVIDGATVVVRGHLFIQAGGALTLTNATVLVEGETTNGIHVQPGGALYIDRCEIRPPSPEHGGFLFQVLPGARFVLKNSRLSGAGVWPGSGDWAGLSVATEQAIIENNVIRDTYCGVGLHSAGDPAAYQVFSNTVLQSQFGICGSGLSCDVRGNVITQSLVNALSWDGDHNTVAGNSISRAWSAGLSVGGLAKQVLDNTVWDSEDGIALSGSDGTLSGNYLSGIRRSSFQLGVVGRNVFAGNTITNCHSEFAFDAGSWDNVLYHNNLISNTLSSADYGSGNQCDNGCQGNYWSRYGGVDANADGIGDSPYAVPPNGVDRYPLMQPWQ
jgi:parallel beta-helix repeat protein